MGTGRRDPTRSHKSCNCCEAGVGLVSGTKSPGTVSGLPNSSSAEEVLRSSFEAVRVHRSDQGSSSIQLGPVRWAFREALSV